MTPGLRTGLRRPPPPPVLGPVCGALDAPASLVRSAQAVRDLEASWEAVWAGVRGIVSRPVLVVADQTGRGGYPLTASHRGDAAGMECLGAWARIAAELVLIHAPCIHGAEDPDEYAGLDVSPLAEVLADPTIAAACVGVSAWPEWDTHEAHIDGVVEWLVRARDAAPGRPVYAPATGTTRPRACAESLRDECERRGVVVAGVDVHLYPSSSDPQVVLDALEGTAAAWGDLPIRLTQLGTRSTDSGGSTRAAYDWLREHGGALGPWPWTPTTGSGATSVQTLLPLLTSSGSPTTDGISVAGWE